MAWIELHQAVWTHRKTYELAVALGVDETYAAAHVIRLWCWAVDNAPTGDLSHLSARAIAYGAGWRSGAAEAFVRALVDVGWLDPEHAIHDWHEYAGRLIKRREDDAKRKRDSRGHLPDVQGTSGGAAAGVRRTGPDRTLTGPDRTISPPVPPSGGAETSGGRKNTTDVAYAATVAVPDLVPLSDDDLAALDRARLKLRDLMSSVNYERLVERLEPLGRSADGAWYLRAPPGEMIAARVKPPLTRALFDEDEQAGRMLTIVES